MGMDFHRATVLDVGSGTGFYVKAWKSLGVQRVVGCDIANTAVEELRRNFPDDEFHEVDIGGDLATLGSHQFDIISAFDVLFHIVDDQHFLRAFQNVHSLLKPGGILIFSDNLLHGRTVRERHQVSRSLEQIERVLQATGFKAVERMPMFFLMNNPIDSEGRLIRSFWRLLAGAVSTSELLGFALGAALYPLELLCVSSLRESPTTEMVICRSVEAPPETPSELLQGEVSRR